VVGPRCSAAAAAPLALLLAAQLVGSGATGCGPAPAERSARPSIALFVIDTLRADAVSAYGAPAGVTPNVDALAREGLLYERAYAPAPWTVPSHATLFTGLDPEQHGTGLYGQMVLPDELETLAERLGAVGYRTASFSENSLIDEAFGMHQGFEHARTRSVGRDTKDEWLRRPGFELERVVREWRDGVGGDDPLFVFVNLYDAHAPYTRRDENTFVPNGLDILDEDLRQPGAAPGAAIAHSAGMCDRLPEPAAIEVLRGLYLGDVAAADAKLGAVRRLLESLGRDWITIVTSDHGEHFGEHRLLGHEYSVREPVLRIPLVVHGVAPRAAVRIPQPVGLADVPVSILAWAGVELPAGLAGRPLPVEPDESGRGRPMLASFTDSPLRPPAPGWRQQDALLDAKRSGCREQDRVFGHTVSLLRFPWKLVSFEHHPSQLYDLSWDPRERSDLSAQNPERLAELERELASWKSGSRLAEPDRPAQLDSETHRALQALGYAE